MHCSRGKLIRRERLAASSDNSFLFCSFDSRSIYELPLTQPTSTAAFEWHLNSTPPLPTSHLDYQRAFRTIHRRLQRGTVEKVVLSRIKEVNLSKGIAELFADLNSAYPNTFNYLISSPELGCWMGATPELLCQIDGLAIKTVALAGTKMAREHWQHKERQEQAYVTQYIADQLRHLRAASITTQGPYTVQAGPVQHLKTDVKALLQREEDRQRILQLLHPTPATCGLPTPTSRELIYTVEHHQRDLYAGFIAWTRETTTTAFVNLRCMQLTARKAWLYVGSGITIDSQVEREWLETERKAQTLLSVIR